MARNFRYEKKFGHTVTKSGTRCDTDVIWATPCSARQFVVDENTIKAALSNSIADALVFEKLSDLFRFV